MKEGTQGGEATIPSHGRALRLGDRPEEPH